ncbi:hypothetical protein [Citrobacter sp. JGM124]|uniref:hypothetical protein n=1 Tax=Citrobacter sp. JGM124 TaxID=2799789 RepID=UPI001BAAC00E|nr:hypothetical protein [Citrobacter sp. JGM124]MBS0849382.1 hypothetical protein [Citrobacter sp. JGM124]
MVKDVLSSYYSELDNTYASLILSHSPPQKTLPVMTPDPRSLFNVMCDDLLDTNTAQNLATFRRATPQNPGRQVPACSIPAAREDLIVQGMLVYFDSHPLSISLTEKRERLFTTAETC